MTNTQRRLFSVISYVAGLALIDPCFSADRPNVIFILSDDLGYGDYGVFFQDQRKAAAERSEPWHGTPQLDKMAGEGIQLRQHYCPAPVCAPSRASLLLGVHQGHANVRDNQFDKELENNHTLGTVMRGAGYATAAIGKWGLQGYSGETEATDRNQKANKNKGRQPKSAGPDFWPGYPTKRGFDFYFGYVRHGDGHAHYPKEDGKELWHNDQEVSDTLDGCYTTDLFTARAKKWITDQQNAQPSQRFFLYLAYDTPHAILQLPATEFPAGQGAKGGLQWLDQPGSMINTAGGTPDSYMHPDYAEAKWDHDRDPSTQQRDWPDVYKRYATGVRRIDDCVGDLLALLEDLGIGDDTLVVFTSDNGPSKESYLKEQYSPEFFNSFGPFDGIKRDLWEGGIRSGAIVRWPAGMTELESTERSAKDTGRISQLPSQFHDWMPTLAEVAGVKPPARCDGTSLVATLTGNGQQQTPQVYVEYFNGQATPKYEEFETSRRGAKRQQMQAIREGDFMGVRYNVRSHEDPFQIFDVVKDPKQRTDLAVKKPDLQLRMHNHVLQLRRPNPSAPRPYDNQPVPAVHVEKRVAGVQWRRYQTSEPWLARLDQLEPSAEGISATIDTVSSELSSIAVGESVLFSGYLEVPNEGDYTFTLPAGASALLRVHDATVLDAGFNAVDTDKSDTIRLSSGTHPFRLYWKQSVAQLGIEISGPNLPQQSVPPEFLTR